MTLERIYTIALVTLAAIILVAGGLMGPQFARASDGAASSAHQFSFPSIDGGAIVLADNAGAPTLVVNTASRCGFTEQYDGLQALWETYRDQGLLLVGVPSNDFRQELADEAAVKHFCEVNFGIDFPMTEILNVRGAAASPFFAWVGEQNAAPRWNFHKYLLDGDGDLVRAYPSTTPPRAIARDIEALL